MTPIQRRRQPWTAWTSRGPLSVARPVQTGDASFDPPHSADGATLVGRQGNYCRHRAARPPAHASDLLLKPDLQYTASASVARPTTGTDKKKYLAAILAPLMFYTDGVNPPPTAIRFVSNLCHILVCVPIKQRLHHHSAELN